MKTLRLLTILSIATLCLVGCTTVRYMETETPTGEIPAPAPATITPNQQSSYVSPAQSQKGENFVGNGSGLREETALEASPTDLSTETMARFRVAYGLKKKPRIAVFLNRQLSDEVRDWVMDSKLVLSDGYSKTKTISGKKIEQTEVIGGISGYSQQQADSGARPSIDEQWMWAFEEGFIHPFLLSGAKMVDRATIMRLTATSSKQQQNSSNYEPIAIKRVEMDALKDYAEIFVEILISRSPSSLYGYAFKATAKEVDTGIIIANGTCLNWHTEDQRQREVVATSDGYEVVDSFINPPVEEIAANLSIDLMNALVNSWGE